jgi:predicted dehydrogenase
VLESGEIGQVFNIETFVGGFGHPCRAWHSEESISGGAIYDWGSHHVDWIIQLYGSAPSVVRCVGHKRVWHDVTNLDQLTLHMLWPDGREATFRQSDVAAIRRPKFYVQGDSGTIEGHYRPMVSERLEPGRGFVREESHHAEAPVDLSISRFDGTASRVVPAADSGWGFHSNLADHLLLGEELAVAPSSTRDVVQVLEAGHRSASEGGSVITLD